MLYLLLVGRKKERKEKKKGKGEMTGLGGGFFPRAGHALLALLCGIFVAVRYN
jgi:hypothetical protein